MKKLVVILTAVSFIACSKIAPFLPDSHSSKSKKEHSRSRIDSSQIYLFKLVSAQTGVMGLDQMFLGQNSLNVYHNVDTFYNDEMSLSQIMSDSFFIVMKDLPPGYPVHAVGCIRGQNDTSDTQLRYWDYTSPAPYDTSIKLLFVKDFTAF